MMSQAIEERSSYWAAFQELRGRQGGEQPSWVRLLREGAIERFEEIGFPNTDEEDWKYTNVAPVARGEFQPAPARPAPEINAVAVEPFVHEEARRSRLVFVNGHFRPELSALESLPAGVVAADLAGAFNGEHSEVVRQHLARTTGQDGDAFTALNTAFLESGAFIFVPKNVAVAAPVQLLFLSTGVGDARHAAFPRVLAVFERGAQATVIESYAATGDGAYFTDAAVEVFVGEGAHVHHYKVQRESERAFHVASTRAELARASAYDLTTVTLGAQLSRHQIAVRLNEEGAECWVDGLYAVGTGQHADTHSLIDHRVPRCTSHQNYKGVLDGKSRAVFNGQVYVHPGAHGTDAVQSNKNLLLSTDARVDTKPQLEIYNDDVKCAHGATVGQLEEEELFYLESRGLPVGLARNLLTYGFAEEIVEKIKVDSIRAQLDEVILNRLHAEFRA